jgi:hypothetical protein
MWMDNNIDEEDYANALDAGGFDDSQIVDGETSFDGVDALLALAGVAAAAYILDGLQTSDGEMQQDDNGDFAVQPRSQIVWHATSDEPCPLCGERDEETFTLESLPCWPGDGGFGEFCEGAGNCNCYLEYLDSSDTSEADNPFSDYTNSFYAQRLAEENALDQQAIDARNADIAAVAQDSPAAAARMAARDALYGVPDPRYGPDGRYAKSISADIEKSESALYKSLAPQVFYSLTMDDVVENQLDETFETSRPNADFVAIVKGVEGSTLPAGAQLQVTKITQGEVEFRLV